VCQGKFCCLLLKEKSTDLDGFTFGAFTGQHVVGGRYYLQTCLLSRTGGKGSTNVNDEDIVRLAGTFTSPHVYPQALLHDQKVGEMTISARGELIANLSQEGGNLATLGLLSRLYELDSENIMELIS